MNPMAALFAFLDSFFKPRGRSSARLIAIGSASIMALYILADVVARFADAPTMNENVMLACVGGLVTLGGGTYWLNRRATTAAGGTPDGQP